MSGISYMNLCQHVTRWDESEEVPIERCDKPPCGKKDRFGVAIKFCEEHAIERGILTNPQLSFPAS